MISSIRILIGLRLGANICVAQTCHCVVSVERNSLHVLLAPRELVASIFIKQTLRPLDLPSMLEPRGLYQTDGERPVGVTMIIWEICKQLVWKITVVDAPVPSRSIRGPLFIPVITATED